MPTYRLNIQFDQAGLDTLNEAGQSVTIVKSVPQGVPVAWISFPPLLNNLVTWNEQYGLRVDVPDPGRDGDLHRVHPGRSRRQHVEARRRALRQRDVQPPPNTYGVVNADPGFQVGGIQMVTSGLYQGVGGDYRASISTFSGLWDDLKLEIALGFVSVH